MPKIPMFVLALCLSSWAATSTTLADVPSSTAATRFAAGTDGVSPSASSPSNPVGPSLDRPDYVFTLDSSTFAAFAAVAPGIRSVKLLIDRRPGPTPDAPPKLYFIDSNVYELHSNFLSMNKLVPRKQLAVVERQTWQSEDRRFIFAQVAHYESSLHETPYVVELFDEDRASTTIIAELLILLDGATDLGTIAFKPNSILQDSRREELTRLGFQVIENDALNVNRLYQVIHPGEPTVGRLRVITETDPSKVEEMIFNRDEIIVLRTIPNDITRVAGIITTRPTTPLSHVSLRARTWNIPNIMLRTALSVISREQLEDRWVRLEVGGDGRPIIRLATEAEVEEAQKNRLESIPLFRIPPADLKAEDLVDLFDLRASDVVTVGAKAANLGELSSLMFNLSHGDLDPVLQMDTTSWIERTLGISISSRKLARMRDRRRAKLFMRQLHVPSGFGIPFSYYQTFLESPPNQHIKQAIAKTTQDARLQGNADFRRQKLEAMQAVIRAGEIPPKLAKKILAKVHSDFPNQKLFIRSSTNCEDLDGFNGAGLYETVANVEGDEAILQAIKRVWASVWNFKAYEARTDAGIRHDAVYPGVLVQAAVHPTAAGVLITKDVLSATGGQRYYLNANPGFGSNTVNTGMGLPEQIYADPLTGELIRISLSERGGDLLTDPQIRRLMFFSAVTERHFGRLAGKFPYPQDIEWLIAGDQISLVQTRPYLEP